MILLPQIMRGNFTICLKPFFSRFIYAFQGPFYSSRIRQMVSLHSFVAAASDTASAVRELDRQVGLAAPRPAFVYAFYGCSHDDNLVHGFLAARFPNAVLLGGTSCAGVMDKARVWGPESIGLLTIDDDAGDYGVAAAPLGDDPARVAEQGLNAALADAGCPGELPELIWIFQAPGREEAVMTGLRRVVGDRCPIIGGSSADDTVTGRWRQLGTAGVLTDGLVVGVLFSSGGIGCAFQGGYEPAGQSGVVTRIECGPGGNGRRIVAIDERPAAEVYNAWTGHALDGKIGRGGSVLRETTMFPIAVDASTVDGIPHFRLIHPESITDAGTLCTFAAVEQGTRIYSMRGDKTRLVERAGRVAHAAASMLPDGEETLAGGLIIYCAGCMLAVGDRMPDVTEEIRRHFGEAPFLGCFTFGEQGRLAERNLHGNLMISAVAFGR